MAILQEDTAYTHIIAIDFGTGASGYAITPRLMEGGKARIEVFNPCDNSDDQKTPTAILFDKDFRFLAFGSQALQEYAEIIDDGDNALLQTHCGFWHEARNSAVALGRTNALADGLGTG